MAKQWPDMIVGLVCQSPLAADCPGLVQLTPGVRRGVTQDHLGQQWVSSEEAVLTRGADVVVVGRGITSANNIADEAKAYQEELWAAYEKRTSNSRV
jgi:orotidine-5'-phosphate decarboxylase